MIKKYNLEDKIIFLNYLNTSQKLYAFKNTDYVVIPSVKTKSGDQEGLPVVLLEGLSLGKITISSPASNSAELVTDYINGFVFDPKKIYESKEVFQNIINLEKSLKLKVMKKALITGKKFSKSSIGKLYYDHLFKELID